MIKNINKDLKDFLVKPFMSQNDFLKMLDKHEIEYSVNDNVVEFTVFHPSNVIFRSTEEDGTVVYSYRRNTSDEVVIENTFDVYNEDFESLLNTISCVFTEEAYWTNSNGKYELIRTSLGEVSQKAYSDLFVEFEKDIDPDLCWFKVYINGDGVDEIGVSKLSTLFNHKRTSLIPGYGFKLSNELFSLVKVDEESNDETEVFKVIKNINVSVNLVDKVFVNKKETNINEAYESLYLATEVMVKNEYRSFLNKALNDSLNKYGLSYNSKTSEIVEKSFDGIEFLNTYTKGLPNLMLFLGYKGSITDGYELSFHTTNGYCRRLSLVEYDSIEAMVDELINTIKTDMNKYLFTEKNSNSKLRKYLCNLMGIRDPFAIKFTPGTIYAEKNDILFSANCLSSGKVLMSLFYGKRNIAKTNYILSNSLDKPAAECILEYIQSVVTEE